jgi:hypothetical protein
LTALRRSSESPACACLHVPFSPIAGCLCPPKFSSGGFLCTDCQLRLQHPINAAAAVTVPMPMGCWLCYDVLICALWLHSCYERCEVEHTRGLHHIVIEQQLQSQPNFEMAGTETPACQPTMHGVTPWVHFVVCALRILNTASNFCYTLQHASDRAFPSRMRKVSAEAKGSS